MIPVNGDQQPEQQSHSQLLPQTFVDEEPNRQARRPWFKRPNIAWYVLYYVLGSSSDVVTGSCVLN